ncbi:MAG: hypothetical protein RLZZ237_3079 [Pseudomonadota bacterium]
MRTPSAFPFCRSKPIMPSSSQTLHMPVSKLIPHARTDQTMCDIVNMGIAVQAAFSTLCALEYLKSYNIDPDLIERVLLQPERRRPSLH